MDSMHADRISPAGLPHSDIRESMDICSSSRLFAACRVLRRLLMPRHSPCALSSLTWFSLRFELCRRHSLEIVLLPSALRRTSTIDYSYHNVMINLSQHYNKTSSLLPYLLCHIVQFSRCVPDFETGLKHSIPLNASICLQLWWR